MLPSCLGTVVRTGPFSSSPPRRVLVVSLDLFVTTAATPAVRPCAPRRLASVGRIHPRAARVALLSSGFAAGCYGGSCSLLLRPTCMLVRHLPSTISHTLHVHAPDNGCIMLIYFPDNAHILARYESDSVCSLVR
ncbi:hypothetical protein VPH35_028594 [Triticum aestivum]